MGLGKPGRNVVITGGAVLGAVGAVALATAALGAIGFTSSGIAAGSFAAKMMSSAAIANGGGVASGSLVAILQSAGAAGLSETAVMVVGSIGGTIGAGVVATVDWLSRICQRRKEEKKMEITNVIIAGIAAVSLITWLKSK
ncbi:interferon alpha-inducible protein 27-like protein 2A [Fundulus heteroclitus]|uniref:interferon alpha-inducible protein 27-like protein 2A n=1 Tax=Fundulus heteroclitus TaxID=8078 RepID=UPI00165B4273|nr:interferon alpha-inducible protein 27-like protein 2A [Fundulus heteroclitus]